MNDDLNIITEQTYRIITDLPYTNANISRNYREQLKAIEQAAERMEKENTDNRWQIEALKQENENIETKYESLRVEFVKLLNFKMFYSCETCKFAIDLTDSPAHAQCAKDGFDLNGYGKTEVFLDVSKMKCSEWEAK